MKSHSDLNNRRGKLYVIESPEVRFLDEGLARLQNGVAQVKLDPIFLETIEGDYLVHVTPYGNASLYVVEVGKDYFVVKARDGDPDVASAWRLSARCKGYAGVRLETGDNDESPELRRALRLPPPGRGRPVSDGAGGPDERRPGPLHLAAGL